MRLSSLLIPCLLATQMATADIIINNGDAVGEGFNDPTITTPAGGNAAHTLGQARLNAFRHAAMLVDSMLSSPVTIQVDAEMNPLDGGTDWAVLGGASPTDIIINFPGAPYINTWYVAALANALSGIDQSPSNDDIEAEFNSAVDGDVVLGTYHWYYGYDKPPIPAVEFLPTVQHEIIHGLGFLTLLNEFGQRHAGFNDAYMLHLEDHDNVPSDFPSMSDSERAAAMVDTGNLHWVGPNVRAAAPGILVEGIDNRDTADHVWMYAPPIYEPGSSTSHFDIDLSPDELMEPYLTDNPDTTLAAALLKDIGWTISSTAPSLPQIDLVTTAIITGSVNPGASPTSLQITATNNSGNTVANPTIELVIPANVSISNPLASSGSCIVLGSLLRCDLYSLAPSTNGTVTLNATVSDGTETTLAFNLSSPLFDTAMANNQASVVINPPAIAPNITITDAQAQEGNAGDTSVLTYIVSLSAATNVNVSVDYALTENSATSGIDYTDASGTLIIPAGSSSAAIPVSLIPDDIIENDETFSITLSNPSSGNIAQANAVGTILNDDFLYVSVSNASINEGNSGQTPTLSFDVTLNNSYTSDVTIDYRTFDVTASSASDYSAAIDTLTIPAGETNGVIPVTVVGDDVYESNETLTLRLSNPSSPAILVQDSAIGTLLNDDPAPTPPPIFSGGGGGGSMGLLLVGLLPLLFRRRVTLQ